MDVYGCEIETVLHLPGVRFETDLATIRPDSFAVLRDAAETLLKNPSLIVEVVGHTDSNGSVSRNFRLSMQRAYSVRHFLVSQGVDGRRLTAKGYGETVPLTDNGTAAGRAKNRRVELRIVER